MIAKRDGTLRKVGSLSARDRSRLAELEQELADLRRSPRSEAIARRINELVEADFTVSWGFEREGDKDSLVDVARSSRYMPASYFDALSAGLRTGRMGFLFSLRVPEVEQRNRPVMFCGRDYSISPTRLASRMGIGPTSPLRDGYLATLDLMEQYGVSSHTQLRTVLCDDSLAIGYLNMILPAAFSSRQRRLFAHAAEMLRNRLVIDRRLSTATALKSSFDTTLEALNRAAFILDVTGKVLHANRLGELALTEERELRDALAMTSLGIPTRFDVIRISDAGSSYAYLAIRRTAELSELAAAIASQLALGERARAVLVLAAAGEPTKAIATRLDVAENTVEYHLGVIFRRLDIGTRGELYQLLLERALAGRR
jgi:DNA-binding CsgD family transcriptional regulator